MRRFALPKYQNIRGLVATMDLWQKESKNTDALYIDLLPSDRNSIAVYSMFSTMLKNGSKKNDSMSAELRAAGNRKYQARNVLEAMDLYNQSLRYATAGSENISLAYANRSACFLHMEKYDNCLVDIELAKKVNYPQRLMPKLIARETECLKFMQTHTPAEVTAKPTLSFEPDKTFPCMANVLQIQSNDKFGKHIVAKADISVDQIVSLEEGYVFDAQRIAQTTCKTCNDFTTSFIPCPNCSDVMFCDTQCLDSNDSHETTCGASYQRMEGAKLFVEPVLKAVSAFANIEDMMEFVENCLATRDFSTLEGLSDAQLKYGLFLKLLGNRMPTDPSNIWKAYFALLDIPAIMSHFDTLKKQRFLMHLILQHILIIETNGMSFGENAEKAIFILGIVSSLFNHSCYHNASSEICANKIICYTVRPIKKGEQVFIRYKTDTTDLTTKERQMFLRDNFRFDCKCSMCVPCYKEEDRVRMRLDPIYQLLTSRRTINDMMQRKSNGKAKFCNFLNKYGHLPWCYEIHLVRSGLDDIMRQELYQAFNLLELID